MLYFAYGSNLSRDRMHERNCDFTSAKSATLKGWKLVFNKRSFKVPTAGFGNIKEDKESEVEGILYELPDNAIHTLDKYEGYPKHYNRIKVNIICKDKELEADAYIAVKEWISEGVKPTKEYLDFFLQGKDFLSESYYQKLLKTETHVAI